MFILIPGFWLNAASWDGVVPALEAAGHRVRALTLPGLASIDDDDRSGLGLADHVAAVVAVVDEAPMRRWPWSVTAVAGRSPTQRSTRGPGRVARVVYVDAPAARRRRRDQRTSCPSLNGEIPLPDWSVFGEGGPRPS